MYKLYLNPSILVPTRLPASPVITAVRGTINLLHALPPEMCLQEDHDWVCSFPAGSDSFPGPGPVSEKNGSVHKGKWAFMPLSIKADRTRSGVEWVSWNNENGVPSDRLCEGFPDKRD